MRLWHKDLIQVLPNKQLIGQWRECCAIASEIHNKGCVKHPLVKKVTEYPADHFLIYVNRILNEMKYRGYKYHINCFNKSVDEYFHLNFNNAINKSTLSLELFEEWHNDRYLTQCFYNLQEKYDCGMISEEEFLKIHNRVSMILDSEDLF